jgi:hypothetical protein
MRLKHRHKRIVQLLKLYYTPSAKLTGKQRLTKLKIGEVLSYILLILLIILALLGVFTYYKVHNSIHIHNITYSNMGHTSMSCYSNFRNTRICCSDDPSLTIRFKNNSKKKPFRVYECSKFKKIE